jgi:ATP-dependent DNA ligase
MALPIKSAYLPTEARAVAKPPEGDEWQYEPKWDGFRCLAFRDGAKIALQSKSGQPLARYFPDLVAALQKLSAKKFVLDGEILIPIKDRSSFDQLLMRVHPAASRVQKLAAEFPALYVVFDLLVDAAGASWEKRPLAERRAELERFAKKYLKRNTSVRLSPATAKLSVAMRWFQTPNLGLDGIMAKRVDLPYLSASRDGMQKIKQRQTVDCVVGGFRYAEGKRIVGSLLLGLYDDAGLLNHVGFTSSFSASDRKELLKVLRPLAKGSGFTGKAPGGPSRWSTKRSSQWEPLEPTLVVEVEYDHFTGERFRHGTNLLRFRPDKRPRDCDFSQLAARRGTKLSLLSAKLTA